MGTILTLDIGTTYFKAALFDGAGRIVALHREAPPIHHPQPAWWELDAPTFQTAVRTAIGRLAESPGNPLADVSAVTFATQTNSFLLLDAHDRPLTPILLWPDERAADLGEALRPLSDVPGFRATTGVPMLTPQFMAAKLFWLRKHQSELWSRAKRLCLISDYLTLWFTGHHVSEAGAAGLTGAVDIHSLRWRPEVCQRLAVPEEWLPDIVRAGFDAGVIRAEVAGDLGLPRGCRLIVGCLDQYAGAIGAGNITAGNVSETTGTVLATIRCASEVNLDVGDDVFQGPAFDAGTYYQMVFGNTSANLLEWYRNQLPARPDFAVLDEAAARVAPGADGLRVRPDFRLDEIDDVFVGLGERHTTGHAARAIMEAVAFALREQVARLCGAQRPREVRSCGGAARSRVWQQIKADVLNVPFVATQCQEPTSLGAAMLATRALEGTSLASLARDWIRTQPPCLPDPERHRAYQAFRMAAVKREEA